MSKKLYYPANECLPVNHKTKPLTPAEIMAQQWVPVTERLPEDGEICLLYKAGFGIGLFQYQTDGGFFADKDAHQFDRDSGGVFWQPLPQPPKEANP